MDQIGADCGLGGHGDHDAGGPGERARSQEGFGVFFEQRGALLEVHRGGFARLAAQAAVGNSVQGRQDGIERGEHVGLGPTQGTEPQGSQLPLEPTKVMLA